MGTVLLLRSLSLSRWYSFVSVPFSMGTVLLRRKAALTQTGIGCFSPLLDGDGVASRHWERFIRSYFVSVPFSMGTVLLLFNHHWIFHRSPRFSPLLDGDGVASRVSKCARRGSRCVSVPFSMGTVLLRDGEGRGAALEVVSVPFSMGTVLLLIESFAKRVEFVLFQSPSRWGRCCFDTANISRDGRYRFQSPSRWGRCCFALGLAP